MSARTEFYLSSPTSTALIQTIVASHPSWSQTYYIQRNIVAGVRLSLPDGDHDFAYYPLRLTFQGQRDTLDFVLHVELGDLGDTIPAELERVMAAGTADTKPSIVYRAFRADDLSAPVDGPLYLQAGPIAMTREGCSFPAQAPATNQNRTGEPYSIARFSCLRGLLT